MCDINPCGSIVHRYLVCVERRVLQRKENKFSQAKKKKKKKVCNLINHMSIKERRIASFNETLSSSYMFACEKEASTVNGDVSFD